MGMMATARMRSEIGRKGATVFWTRKCGGGERRRKFKELTMQLWLIAPYSLLLTRLATLRMRSGMGRKCTAFFD